VDERGRQVAAQLRALGVRGILIMAAERGYITALACQMDECLCPLEIGGRTYFQPVAPDLPDWMPSHEHHPIPKHRGGTRTVENSLLAHRLCNRIAYAKSVGRPYERDLRRVEEARRDAMRSRQHARNQAPGKDGGAEPHKTG
jgi:hypothetical protein